MKNIFALLLCILVTANANAELMSVIDLGASFRPTAVNSSGVVVGQDIATGIAAMWQNGIVTSLGTVGGTQSYANDINDSGVVVGWSFDSAGKQKAFRWDSTGGMVNLGAGQTLEGAAEAVNNDGLIVGWRTNGTTTKAARWTPGNPQWLSIFTSEAVNHKALGINEQATIVGITLNSSGDLVDSFYHNGSFNINNFTDILAQSYNPQAGVNNSLLTAGLQGDRATYLVIGPNNDISLEKLLPTDNFAAAYGLNNNGLIVGTSGDKGFVYNSVTSQLQDTNAFTRTGFSVDQINSLTGINDFGFYVGEATVGGIRHGIAGFITVPEPSSFVLLATSLMLVGRRSNRSCRSRPSRGAT